MTELHTIPVLIEYNKSDCKKGNDWLVKDIANTIAEKLVPRIDKPIKATLLITYFGLKDDKHRNGRPSREQAKSRSNGIQDNVRRNSGNKKAKN